MQTILEALARARAGRAEWLIFSGEPGIGKSALLATVRARITGADVWMAAGSFARDGVPAPFAVLVSLLAGLVHQCLAAPPTVITALREQLRATLGPNARLLGSLAPELAQLLGPQPPQALLEPVEQRNRLYLALRGFLTVLATTQRPVVIMLDNLQWADASSLEALRRLFIEGPLSHLLLLGAYHDTDLRPGAPLPLLLRELQRNELPVHTSGLEPLPVIAIGQILTARLGTTPDALDALAQIIHAKTHGNPLFVSQLVQRLVEQHLLHRDPRTNEWRWELAAIAAIPAPATVEPLLQERVALLGEATQSRLALAACMGAEFSPAQLAAVAAEEESVTLAALQPALAAALIYADAERWGFVHDQVRHVILQRADPAQIARLHRAIGQMLLARTPAAARPAAIFAIVTHLNAGHAGDTSAAPAPGSAHEMASLNLEAAVAALGTLAGRAAGAYARSGRAWLEAAGAGWDYDAPMTLALHEAGIKAALLAGDHVVVEELASAVIEHNQDPLAQLSAYRALSAVHTARGNLAQALDDVLAALAKLGVPFPLHPSRLALWREMARTYWVLRRTPDAAIVGRTPSPDAQHWAAAELLTTSFLPARWGNRQRLLALRALRGVRWTVQSGPSPLSALSLAHLGAAMATRFNDLALARRCAQLASTLLDAPAIAPYRASGALSINALLRHRVAPFRETLAPLREVIRQALESGDLRLAADATGVYINHARLSGEPLPDLIQESGSTIDAIARFGSSPSIALQLCQLMRRQLINLADVSAEPLQMSGDGLDEGELLALLTGTQSRLGLATFHYLKLQLCLHFNESGAALHQAEMLSAHSDALSFTIVEPDACALGALARLDACESAAQPQRRRLLRQVDASLGKLRRWAEQTPVNHLHRYWLVSAARSWVLGRPAAATEQARQALEHANAQGFVAEAALIAERLARWAENDDQPDQRRANQALALDAYRRWGAAAKVHQLAQSLPDLRPAAAVARVDTAAQVTGEVTPVAAEASARESAPPGLPAPLRTALQSLSAATDAESLLRTFLGALLSSTGAARSVMILPEAAGLTVRARADAGASTARIVLVAEPLESISHDDHVLPLSVIHYATQVRQRVVLAAGAYPDHFSGDPYLRFHAPSAVLCLPLYLAEQLLGVVYIEYLTPFAASAPDAGRATAPEQDLSPPTTTSDLSVKIEHAELLGMRALLIWENMQLHARLLGSSSPRAGIASHMVGEQVGLVVRLLGQRRFVHQGEEITPLLQERMQVLLALLLLRPHAQTPRSELAQALWPEASATQGQTNLRNLIFKLRQLWPGCADLLDFDRKTVAWKAGVAIDADVAAFQRAVQAGMVSSGLAAQRAMEQAAVLYQGEFLPGAADEALAAPRALLHDQYLTVLDRLVMLQTERNAPALALRHAQQLLAADPLRETSYHHLIRLHALLGDTASARLAYEACLTMLHQEFGAPPSPLTELIFAQYVEP